MAHIIKLKPLPNGEARWGVRWKEGGDRKQRSFKSKMDAQAFRAEKDIETPRQRKKVKKTFGETPVFETVANAYLSYLEQPRPGEDPKEPRTIKTYRSILQNHVLPHIGQKRINRITSETYENIHRLCTTEGMSPTSTRKEALRLTHAVLGYAFDQHLIESIPENRIKNQLSRSEKQKEKLKEDKKYFTPDEVSTILSAADSLANDDNTRTRQSWARYRPLVYFLVYTGARISEARAFTRDNYRPETGWIRITESAPEGVGTNNAKNLASIRRIPLIPDLCPVMDAWLGSHNRQYVFGTKADRPVSLTTLYPRLLEPLFDRADALTASDNLPRVRRDRKFHALRHHYASWAVASGATPKELQTYMGHEKFSFTMDVYGHLFDDGGDFASKMQAKAPRTAS